MQREPLFNVPGVVVFLLTVLVLVHAARDFLLSERQDLQFILTFAFIPARYGSSLLGAAFPGGGGAEIWTFLTYAFIHGDWMHLSINAVWLLAFGSALARRFGAARFLAFFAVTAIAGALAHLITHQAEQGPVVGASAAISGTMAAAMRFAFQRGGPLGFWQNRDEAAYRVPALPLRGVLRDPRVIAFLVVWFGVNLLFGIGSSPITGDQPVAWEAHIGGFLAGLLLFSLFDPVPKVRPPEQTVA